MVTGQFQPEDQPEYTKADVTEATEKELVKADAKERSKRTFLSGLAIAVLAAVVTAALQVVGNWTQNDYLSQASWLILGTSLLQAAFMAGLSYMQRFLSTPQITPTA